MTRDRRAILNALAANGEPATPAEIAALANLKPGNVKHIVIRMLRDSLLVKADRGKYAAVGDVR